MKILVVADGHYFKDENGVYYADSVYDYNFFCRYIKIFGSISIACRVEKVSSQECKRYKKCSGENISFIDLTPFQGPIEYVKKYVKIKKEAAGIVSAFDKAIFRIPGAVSNVLLSEYAKLHRPFALEVVVDPWEFFAPGTTKGISRPIVRFSWTNFTKKMCLKASAVSYVTQYYLQNRYPAGVNAITSYYSSVELKDESIKAERIYTEKNQFTISHVCNGFATYGKGHIQLIKALKLVRERGFDVSVTFVGDGPLRNEFEKVAISHGVFDYVNFMGSLPGGDEVREVIRKSDLFVFPTRAEGLPRVLLEAMAEGLPCISTRVCGIPELLPDEFLTDYDNYQELADIIVRLIRNPKKMTKASRDNIEKVREYTNSKLTMRRDAFYKEFLTIDFPREEKK